MMEITKRQQEIVDFIKEFTREKGYAPTIREIADAFNVSLGAIQDIMNALLRKNLIQKEKGLSRAIRLVESDKRIPLYSAARGGIPRIVDEKPKEYLNPETALGVKPGDKALQIVGDSMIEVGITDGSIVFFRPTKDVQDGDIVVVRLDDGVTVKTFMRHGKKIVLKPENQNYEPITLEASVDNFEILGKVISVVNRFTKFKRRKYQSDSNM